ncbi:hypothetical protein XENOCAPTIV_019124 [Xenoophorus captivus]|uniref:Uncharacterized protein n=1 Tax=Xenoophorus captivus TaxID=1517983 RepID=A0ABV0RE36_9TELE
MYAIFLQDTRCISNAFVICTSTLRNDSQGDVISIVPREPNDSLCPLNRSLCSQSLTCVPVLSSDVSVLVISSDVSLQKYRARASLHKQIDDCQLSVPAPRISYKMRPLKTAFEGTISSSHWIHTYSFRRFLLVDISLNEAPAKRCVKCSLKIPS